MIQDDHINELDKIWMNKGKHQLLIKWKELRQRDYNQCLNLINQPSLSFPTLFLLCDEINIQELTVRNQIAVHHIYNTLKGTDIGIIEQKHFTDQHHEVIDSFHWMIKTGGYSLINPDYAQVIDHASIQMLLTYREDLTKEAVDIIFFRHRHHIHRHYLTWGFFEASEPKHLIYICNYLHSSSNQDQQLARKLLHFIPRLNQMTDVIEAYHYCRLWVLDNAQFLVKSGETNDMNPMPTPFYLHLCGKYLGIFISYKTGEALSTLTQFEAERWQKFLTNLTLNQQKSLADHSLKYRLLNPSNWKEWLQQPIDKQLNDLKGVSE